MKTWRNAGCFGRRWRRGLLWLTGLTLLAAAQSCGRLPPEQPTHEADGGPWLDSDAGLPGTDGGGEPDAGLPGPDGGGEPDAGLPGPDGGGEPDAGLPEPDGGEIDAGLPELDGGNEPDAGIAEDAGTDAGVATDGGLPDAGSPDAGCAACELGCADGTREGFTNRVQWPAIAACAGAWTGWIDEAPAASLCGPGWHVCTGTDTAVGQVWASHANAFGGCFAFDTAHDCWACYPTCRGAVGACLKCCVSTNVNDPDMGGMGTGCTQYVGAGPGGSCLGVGRVDATVNSTGCQWAPHLTGVVCCRD